MPRTRSATKAKKALAPAEAPGLAKRRNLWVALLFAFLAGVVCYAPITKYQLYDDDRGAVSGDSNFYVQMQQGQPLQNIMRPYRYRVLTPWLASLVPFLPDVIAKTYVIDDQKVLKFKFAVVNAALLWLTAMALWFWLPSLGLSSKEALLACQLFFGCFHVVVNAGTALVEAGAYASLAVGLWAAFDGPAWSFGLALGLGLFFKETAILLVPAVMLAFKGERRWKLLAWSLPGMAAYAFFREIAFPGGDGTNYDLSLALSSLSQLVSPRFLVYVALELALCFGPLWFFAWHGWRKLPKAQPLRRLAPFAILPLLAPFALHTVYGRVFFLSFPVLLPLAVLGLRELWPEKSPV